MREVAAREERTAAAQGCDVNAVVRSGIASDVILEVATDTHAGLIVMGAHSHTRIREWFVGCHTVRILADSAVPALLVR
jgi:nucleotide-binding universal stress UspA family protein